MFPIISFVAGNSLPSVDWTMKGFFCVVRVCRQTTSHSNTNCLRVFRFRIQSPHTSHWLCSKHWIEATSFFGRSTQLAHSIGFVIVRWKVQTQDKHGWYILVWFAFTAMASTVQWSHREGAEEREKRWKKSTSVLVQDFEHKVPT